MRILQPTLYHGEEIDAKTGETWWGLYQDGEGFTLRPTVIKVDRVYDPMGDEDGEATGKKVTAAGIEQPMLLIHGLPDPKEGPVKSSFSGSRFVFPGDYEDLPCDWRSDQDDQNSGDDYHLSALGTGLDGKYWPVITDYNLMLYRNTSNGGGETQRLTFTERCDMDGRPVMLWAGDLDGDGKLDLLMDLTDHYNITALTLFLSTSAKEGEIVGKAAELVTYGC